MKNALAGSAVTLVVLAIIGLVVIFSGVVNVAADSPPPAMMEWVLESTMHRSVAVRANDIEVPDLDDPAMLTEGASHYDTMCVSCHGAPGVEPGEIAMGLDPKPPELASEESIDPATFFWITKHGVTMTGMPAWGETHDDASLWSMVALMTRFDEMSPEEYRRLVSSSDAHDHGEHAH